MAHTATQLYSGTLGTSGELTVYTAPSATTTMVQSIIAVNNDSSSLTLTIKANGQLIRKAVSIAAGDVFEWKGLIILNASETLKMTASSAGWAQVSVAGVEIT